MTDELQDLIERYVDGSASPEDIRRLDALVQQDPAARHGLLVSAAMDAHLRELLSVATPQPAVASPGRSRVSWGGILRLAAVLLLSVAGWAMALLFAFLYRSEGHQRQAVLRELAVQQAQQRADHGPPFAAGRVVETRGLVLSLPEGRTEPDGRGDFREVSAGTPIPLGRALWTCPWGAAGMQFADGASMQLDRSTVVAFSETNGVRQALVKKGIFFVSNEAEAHASPVLVTTAQASAKVVDAQVAVAASAKRTIVEVATGRVPITRTSDGRTFTVERGHYAVVADSGEPQIVAGRLDWHLEPARSGK
jgi:ferric-dicitrate binding protein FerR (iron transport regulator)